MLLQDAVNPTTATILDDAFLGVSGMRQAYDWLKILPTSEVADVFLIRSHIAYWAGRKASQQAEIRPSRGHSYRFECNGSKYVVHIADHYDHREGVTGFSTSNGYRVDNREMPFGC